MSIIFWIMVLIVEGRIARRPVHHTGRLSVHHVAHRRIRTIRPARSCRQWWKHYTLLRLDLCSVIGRRVLDKLVVTPSKVLEELENSMATRYSDPSRAEGRFARRKSEMCSGTFNNPSMKLLVIRDAIPDTPDLITHPPGCCWVSYSRSPIIPSKSEIKTRQETRQIYLGRIMEATDAFYRGIVTKCTVRSQLYGTSVPLLRFYCVVLVAREGATILPVLPAL
ncbi:hypothetical protein X777_09179 [Ooceraea biroi]|uniref:Secreted protein n=1 Tax=Ooceraea biroi TaxID=2015173 RepID=A0A026W8A2_OOCBI|nr:hypothetical protein X777_09179 [Ooceraea biroi]